jgi:TPR repeat protein
MTTFTELKALPFVSDPDSQYERAMAFYNLDNSIEAMKACLSWIRKAAKQEHIAAQAFLGASYYFGSNTLTKDVKQAFKYANKAALEGDAGSLFILGLCFYHNQADEHDATKAIACLGQAASQGFKLAKSELLRIQMLGEMAKETLKANSAPSYGAELPYMYGDTHGK